ncbi:MAG: sugar phosphate nucleotidyltransferase, partial [Methanopyri archaeon]|nr:sugar phosphate nucleotidyltransferase [Methanopyri archaeon]
MKAIVLAGGEGTRLRPLSFYFQKCMMPLGHQGKPLMEYIVRLLCHHDICDVKVLVGAHAEQITNYFEDGSRFGA